MKSINNNKAPSLPDGHGLIYHDILDALDDPVLVIDAQGTPQYANLAFVKAFGYGPDVLTAMPFWTILMQDEAAGFQKQIADCLESGAPGFTVSQILACKTGEWELFEIHAKALAQPGGGALFVLNLRRIQDPTQEQQEKFRKMVEGAPDPVFIQTEGKLAYINPAACRLFGVQSPEVLLGTPVIDRVHPDNREKALERIRRLNILRKPIRELFEQRFLRVDGSEVWVETKAELIEFEGKHGALVFVRDATERKITEQKLWESTERFRVAFEHSASGMCLMGIDGTFSMVNQAMCGMFGYEKEELEGKTFGDVTYPEDNHLSTRAVNRMLSGETPVVHLEKRYLRKNGEVFWAGVSSALLRDGEGRPAYFIVQIRDITERKEMERELTEKEAFSRAVMDNLPIGIAVNSIFPEVSFKYMNDKFPLYYRTTKEVLKDPDTFWEAAYENPDFREAIRERVLNDMASGDPKRRAWENIPITRKGMEDRYVSAYNTPVPDGGLVISTVMDVTQRIRDEQALLKNAKRLNMLHEIDQAVLKGVDSPETIAGAALMWLNDMLHIKRAAIDIFGPDETDMRVMAVDVDGETAVRVLRQPLKQMYGYLEARQDEALDFAENTHLADLPSPVVQMLGEESACSYMLAPLNAAGRLIGAMSLGWEVPRTFASEEKAIAQEVASQLALAIEQSHMRHELSVHAAELERRVKERTAQYEAANKELEAFSYSVSHDLRAPLRSVDGYVQILLEDYSEHLDDNGKRVCNIISNSAKQMGRLIDDLLAFSRVGRADMKLMNVDMGELARSIYHELTSEAERAAIDITFDPLPMALADPGLMRQVIMNLLSNAIKFSSKKTKTVIRFGGEERDDDIVYSVKDQGAGFDQKYADKLFGVFQRLHSVREFEGTGVGLAIVQRIISRHGGSVWAEGKPGEGAAFYFSLKKGDDHVAL